MKNLKLISTILLSILLIFIISTAVFADNEEVNDIWADVNVIEDNNTVNNTFENNTFENNTFENNTFENNTTNDLENEFANVNVENKVNNTAENEYNNLYTTRNSTTSNSENLADTGIGDSNGIMAIIVILSIVIAIYSAKKISEYKNI